MAGKETRASTALGRWWEFDEAIWPLPWIEQIGADPRFMKDLRVLKSDLKRVHERDPTKGKR